MACFHVAGVQCSECAWMYQEPVKSVQVQHVAGAAPLVMPAMMSLRDYFAGQALVGMLADPNNYEGVSSNAKTAYEIADAMLAAREKK